MISSAVVLRVIDSKSRGKVIYFDADLDCVVPESDADVLLIEFPNGLHIDVAWDDRLRRFHVVLFADEFGSVISERYEPSWSGISDALRVLSGYVYAQNSYSNASTVTPPQIAPRRSSETQTTVSFGSSPSYNMAMG